LFFTSLPNFVEIGALYHIAAIGTIDTNGRLASFSMKNFFIF